MPVRRQFAYVSNGGEINIVPERIRVFVVDDHALFRAGLLRLLDADETLVVVGSAASAASALEQLKHIETDVLILDYQLGTDNALTVARGLRERNFQGRSLVVTAGLPDQDALELIRLGVSGIFHKVHSPEDLHRTIREVAAGKMLIDQSYVQKLAESMTQLRDTPSRLTERDRRVLRLLLEGYSNKEIATELKLSESSAKAALQQLFARTGVRTRSQLVRIALEKLRDEI
jgi:two-component system nitrate/nitrite response regulator NarL